MCVVFFTGYEKQEGRVKRGEGPCLVLIWSLSAYLILRILLKGQNNVTKRKRCINEAKSQFVLKTA